MTTEYLDMMTASSYSRRHRESSGSPTKADRYSHPQSRGNPIMPQVTAANQQTAQTIAAYEIPQIYTFKVLLTKGDQERCETIKTQGDRFCNVVCEIKQLFPGWSIYESWEVSHVG